MQRLGSFTVQPALAKVMLMVFAAIVMASPTRAQDPSQQILNNPDAFAWTVFVEISHPADLTKGRGVPDPSKAIGADGPVVWQTWMRTDEIFLDRGVRPPAWDAAPGVTPLGLAPVTRQRFRSPRKILLEDVPRAEFKILRAGEPPPAELSESSMNRAAFEFVVQNELYNIEGQEAFQTSGTLINLPPAAREIKSAWKLLSPLPIDEIPPGNLDQFRKRYHTTTLSHEGKTYIYGLSALHITTKDLPNWVWTTFEHVDNPTPELADNDRAGQPSSLKGTKWEHYRLRGTQVDFVDSAGQPTVLANTQIEAGFQQTSSCITCHSRATIGDPLAVQPGTPKRANRLPFFEVYRILHRHTAGGTGDQVIRYGNIGSPYPDWFNENRIRRKYTQLDFMWSLRNAQSKQP